MGKVQPNAKRLRVCPKCKSVDTKREKLPSGFFQSKCNACGYWQSSQFQKLADQYDAPWERGTVSLGKGGRYRPPAPHDE